MFDFHEAKAVNLFLEKYTNSLPSWIYNEGIVARCFTINLDII